MYRSVVAVGAHPDDVEGGCGGTLLKMGDAGSRITVVSITNGEKGSFHEPDMPYPDTVRIREAEAQAAAALLGAEYLSLGAEDQFLFDTKEIRLALQEVLRRVECDIVLVSPPVDYQADHTLAADIALEACHLAALPQLASAYPALPYDPVMYYYDATLSLDFQPTFYVDITDVMERKMALYATHPSQVLAAELEHGWGLGEAGRTKGRMRGMQSGVTYAEGFAPCLRWPRVRALKAFPE